MSYYEVWKDEKAASKASREVEQHHSTPHYWLHDTWRKLFTKLLQNQNTGHFLQLLSLSTDLAWQYSTATTICTVLYCTALYCTVLYCTVLPTWRGSTPPPPPSARTSASPPAPTCGRAGRCSLNMIETLFSTTYFAVTRIELQTKVCEHFTIMEKDPTRHTTVTNTDTFIWSKISSQSAVS